MKLGGYIKDKLNRLSSYMGLTNTVLLIINLSFTINKSIWLAIFMLTGLMFAAIILLWLDEIFIRREEMKNQVKRNPLFMETYKDVKEIKKYLRCKCDNRKEI